MQVHILDINYKRSKLSLLLDNENLGYWMNWIHKENVIS